MCWSRQTSPTYRDADLQDMEELTGRIRVQAWMGGNVCQRCVCNLDDAKSCEIHHLLSYIRAKKSGKQVSFTLTLLAVPPSMLNMNSTSLDRSRSLKAFLKDLGNI